jgi:hypothetical protein
MQKTSIHVRPITPSSEEHNQRLKPLDYVKKELSQENSSLVTSSIAETLKEIKANYRATVKQKMQKDATPIREAVVVLDKNTKMKDLEKLAEKMEERFGLKTFQIHIHEDEGHTNKKGEFIKNRHAHMVIDWTEGKTGKSIKLNKKDMAEMQTLTAECLGMERGKSSDKVHLTAIQFKNEAQKEELRQVEIERNKAKIDLQMTKAHNSAAKTWEGVKKALFEGIKRVFRIDEGSKEASRLKMTLNQERKAAEERENAIQTRLQMATRAATNEQANLVAVIKNERVEHQRYYDKVGDQGREINDLRKRNAELSTNTMKLENQVRKLTPTQGKNQQKSRGV